MSLHPTPDMMQTAYEYLRAATPLFRRLPDGDDVVFNVGTTRGYMGCWWKNAKGAHEYVVSASRVGSTHTLIEVMAHEMIHGHQDINRTAHSDAEHNSEFRRLARIVAKLHCFDPKAL